MKGSSIKIEVSISSIEKEIVQKLSYGMTARDAAKDLKKNFRTIEANLVSLRARVGAKTQCELVAFFLRNKIIE